MIPAALAAVAAIKLVSVLPPPQYDHVPAVAPDYQYISPQAMQLICFRGPRDPIIYSCSRMNRLGWCEVYLPNSSFGVSPAAVVMLKRHEDGHCNGWSGDHPGAIIGGLV